jgi:hypothetical protein
MARSGWIGKVALLLFWSALIGVVVGAVFLGMWLGNAIQEHRSSCSGSLS